MNKRSRSLLVCLILGLPALASPLAQSLAPVAIPIANTAATLAKATTVLDSVIARIHADGWHVVANRYDDGGFSGGNMERPGLKKLLGDIAMKRVDNVVVYKGRKIPILKGEKIRLYDAP